MALPWPLLGTSCPHFKVSVKSGAPHCLTLYFFGSPLARYGHGAALETEKRGRESFRGQAGSLSLPSGPGFSQDALP